MFLASLARFYGWTHEEIQGMDYAVAVKYWKAINVIQAREYLVNMNVQDYPRMKKDARKQFYKDMRKQAYPRHLQKTMDYDEFARKAGLINGGRTRS